MQLDQDQAHALVYGLSNGRVSQQQIALMASDLAEISSPAVDLGRTISSGREDWSHWANTLSETLPGGAAQDLVRTVQTGQLDTVRASLNGKQQSAIEYGVGAIAGGATRFLFGNEVVAASREAFAQAPSEFPEHLSDQLLIKAEEDQESNRALAAMEDAAKVTGTWVTNTAERSTRSFRRVDLDGDGIPDDPRAFSAAKGVGNAVADAVTTGARAFRRVDLDGDGVLDEPQALSALRGAGAGAASRLRHRKDRGHELESPEPASDSDEENPND